MSYAGPTGPRGPSSHTPWPIDDFILLTGHHEQDWDFVVPSIQATYFGKFNGKLRSPADIVHAAHNSICRGLRSRRLNQQIAFARIVSDQTCYSWLADVVVHKDYRRRGIGAFLLRAIIEDPVLRKTTFNLFSEDAMPFYAKEGFVATAMQMIRVGR